jgi:hypothetical protein
MLPTPDYRHGDPSADSFGNLWRRLALVGAL